MKLLAIVAHPDDADIFCGGTLAKHADRGDEVVVAHMTRGEYGGLADTSEDELADVRRTEAENSGSVLGADVEFLGFEDGRITYSLDARLDLVEVIRDHSPDLLVTHFEDDMHPDHRTTSRLVTDAYYMASLPLVDVEGEPADPDNVYYFGKPTSSFEPSVYVDVTEYVDVKEEAVQQHESQVEFLREHGGIDAEFEGLIEGIRAEARTLGKQASTTYAEGFTTLHGAAQEYLG